MIVVSIPAISPRMRSEFSAGISPISSTVQLNKQTAEEVVKTSRQKTVASGAGSQVPDDPTDRLQGMA